jgi:hypothetical protein
MSWEKVGTIDVDSGTCWIGDPCYCVTPDARNHPAKNWEEFCSKLSESNFDRIGFTQFTSGVCVHTGYGDGEYEVFVKSDGNRISEVKIVFVE